MGETLLLSYQESWTQTNKTMADTILNCLELLILSEPDYVIFMDRNLPFTPNIIHWNTSEPKNSSHRDKCVSCKEFPYSISTSFQLKENRTKSLMGSHDKYRKPKRTVPSQKRFIVPWFKTMHTFWSNSYQIVTWIRLDSMYWASRWDQNDEPTKAPLLLEKYAIQS